MANHEKQLLELARAALDQAEDDREAYLREQCGENVELLRSVLALMDQCRQTSELLVRSPLEQITLSHSETGDSSGAWTAFLSQLGRPRLAWERYQIEGEIARGGMGVVHAARDGELRRTVALKVMLEETSTADSRTSDSLLGRFLEEAQVTSQLEHPGIVPVYQIGVDPEERLFFTMKLVRGQTLRAVFQQANDPGQTHWSRTRALSTLVRVCEAMAYAHAKGVIHRDLKPANVMVGQYGETYVMDWGLARLVHAKDQHDLRIRPAESHDQLLTERGDRLTDRDVSPLLTMDGDVMGTPAYMSPEQALGRLDEMGPASDVYAVGAMLYQLLTGRAPYSDPGVLRSLRAVLEAVRAGPPTPLHRLADEVPEELQAICEKAMARDPVRRYASMEALGDDLRAYLEQRVVSAYATGPLAELKKWMLRNRALTRTTGVAALLLLTLACWSFLSIREQRNAATAHAEEAEAGRLRVLRLADVKRLENLVEDSERLWPARPGRVAGMQTWLDRAHDLLSRRPLHEQTLAQLRRRGLPLAGNAEVVDFGTDTEAQWWHDTLRDLLLDLDALSAEDPYGITLASMRRRLDSAGKLEQWSITFYRDDWDDALASIADPGECPFYAGLELEAQLGLVPIGQDPETGFWEFWHVQSGERPQRDEQGRLVLSDDSGVVLVLIPAGRYWMGAQALDPDGQNYDPMTDEIDAIKERNPPVEEQIAPFFVSKFELTQGQWFQATGTNPSLYKAGTHLPDQDVSLRNPVEQISFNDAVRIATRLDLSLPSEEQWEYICRAGTGTPWWAPRDELDQVGNLADRSSKERGAAAWVVEQDLWDKYTAHAPVGSFRANAFGVHDTLGNLWEWCLGEFTQYEDEPPLEPGETPRDYLAVSGQVMRGGSYATPAIAARSANRERNDESYRDSQIGVRLARALRR